VRFNFVCVCVSVFYGCLCVCGKLSGFGNFGVCGCVCFFLIFCGVCVCLL